MKACDRTNWSRPPSAFFGGKTWGDRDHLLLLAYQRFVDTTCVECGGYVVECRNPENRGVYEVNTDSYCYRKQALEDVTRAEKFEAEHGQLFSVAPIDESIVKRATLTLQGQAPAVPDDGQEQS